REVGLNAWLDGQAEQFAGHGVEWLEARREPADGHLVVRAPGALLSARQVAEAGNVEGGRLLPRHQRRAEDGVASLQLAGVAAIHVPLLPGDGQVPGAGDRRVAARNGLGGERAIALPAHDDDVFRREVRQPLPLDRLLAVLLHQSTNFTDEMVGELA